MLSRAIQWISDWFYLTSPLIVLIGFPLVLAASMWRSWSHAGDLALDWRDKLLRLTIFGLVVVALGFVAWLLAPPPSGSGWDLTAP